MIIKNISGFLAMFAVTLLIAFTFTACEEDPVEDPGIITPLPIPKAVDSLKAGATNDSTIRVTWRHSPDRDSVWFKEYHVEIARAGMTPQTATVAKNYNGVDVPVDNGIVYTFTVTAISDSGKVSSEKSINWAASKFFNTVSGEPIRVYGSAASYGSGLRLFDGTEPSIHTVSQGANWNLGLYTRNDSLVFGSASVVGPLYNNFQGTPANAYITDVLYDDAALSGLLLDKDLSTLTFSAKAINLKANTNSQGAVFFARVGSGNTAHYAKVIVRKSGGNYLQGTGNNQYIEVVISYQTAAGVPYAKIFAGK